MALGDLKHVGTPGQKKTTRALHKFCKEHNHAPGYISDLEIFQSALKSKDVVVLQKLIKKLRHAGMGSFLDWFPAAVYEHETEEYVDSIWNALYGHWVEQIKPIEDVKNA